jgi:predicted Zn-dependent protease
MAARVALAAAALAVVAWLAVGLRAARLASDGADVARGAAQVSPGRRTSQALHRLRDAASRTPDKDPDDDRAWLLHRLGRDAAAIEVLVRLTRAQPDNAEYWADLARVSARTRPAVARAARARLRTLVPLVAPA